MNTYCKTTETFYLLYIFIFTTVLWWGHYFSKVTSSGLNLLPVETCYITADGEEINILLAKTEKQETKKIFIKVVVVCDHLVLYCWLLCHYYGTPDTHLHSVSKI